MTAYLLRFFALQKDLLWLPAAFWGVFATLLLLNISPGDEATLAVIYLGYLLPLLAGGLATYSLLQDEALELLFAQPAPAWRMVLERIGSVAAVIAACGLSFQLLLKALHVDPGLGDGWATVLAWALPCLALMCSGFMISLLARHSSLGGAFVGTVWILQVLLQEWLAGHRAGRYVLLFLGSLQPESSYLPANQITLLGITVFSIAVSIRLLQRQERYL